MEAQSGAIEIRKVGMLDFGAAALEKLKLLPGLLDDVYKSVLQKDTDYGTIPGTPKPTLFKPGAETLSRWLNMAPDITTVEKTEQIDPTNPYFSYTCECRLYDKSGYLGNGFGSANSREPGFAFRWLYESQVPNDVDRSTLEQRKLKNATQYRYLTPPNEIFGLANTILKRASKRAFVEAVLRVTGASRIFTQDVEDMEPSEAAAKARDVSNEATVVPSADLPELTKEGLEYVLRDIDGLTISGGTGVWRVYPTNQMLLDTATMAKLTEILAKYSAAYVQKNGTEKAHFEIKVKA